MSAQATGFQPLPQAPTAIKPVISPEGVARSTWAPNVFHWVAVWRLLVVVQGFVTLLLPTGIQHSLLPLQLAAAYSTLTTFFVIRPLSRRLLWPVLIADLAVCIGLMAIADTPETFALMALYSYSTVVTWASSRPVDSCIAGGIGAIGYTVFGLLGPYSDGGVTSSFYSNLALYLFFALATSGFFTVARRISALEIASEVSRERGRYRRDLHDRLGQALCGLHFELQAVHASGVSEGVRGRLESLANGYRDARVMLTDLFRQTEEPLVATNIAALIQQEARRMATQTGARIAVTVQGEAALIPPWMRPHVWSIAGECMTNALKNGGATGIDIDLTIEDGLIVLSVADDGSGFEMPDGQLPDKEGHYGLREMQERARICGGEVVFASAPGFGTRVRLQLPLPDNAESDLVERDASRLRENVWSLLVALRSALALVAVIQFSVVAFDHDRRAIALLLVALTTLDFLGVAILRKRLLALLNRRATLLVAMLPVYGTMLAATLALDVQPYFMLYAPLLLLAAGVTGGRRHAAWLTAGMLLTMAVVLTVALLAGGVAGRELQVALMHLTNMVIIGMSATQGAKLLDRLEALQIRVRYQALARLRHGLSSRMRDQLVERLDELESETRTLAKDEPEAEAFLQVTSRLQQGSTDLKARLRDIVHQLADPTPERTSHVG